MEENQNAELAKKHLDLAEGREIGGSQYHYNCAQVYAQLAVADAVNRLADMIESDSESSFLRDLWGKS